ncbi:DUF3025 domain-containing protein [Gallaecimonas sp. GXIMD1310]|uniref:DUF3025 domain-containing protein n=1 Tax=Gallaecimonas sp. GXIMD1310 TaxID=3131926 RepID=UPI003247083C
MNHWRTDIWRQPPFAELAEQFALAECSHFPNADTLSHWLPATTQTASGWPLRFCHQVAPSAYEQHIWDSGQVPTRADNWHDLFNALTWARFPQAKAAINRQHVADINRHGLHPRTLRRDTLTLFDECGVLVLSSDTALLEALRQHQWQQAFVTERGRWGKSISAMVFGHAIYEQLLTPYLGLTGKMLPVQVKHAFFDWPAAQQLAWLDEHLAALLAADVLADKTRLSPLPVLGIPHWWPANRQAAFYDNRDYFRPLQRPRTALQY